MGASSSKKKELQEKQMNERISATRKEILRIQSQIESSERELNEMKRQLNMTRTNSVKEDDMKRDLVNKIKNYKRLTNYKKNLESNLGIMEKKKQENRVVDILDKNTKAIDSLGNRNDEIIIDNLNNIQMQNQVLDYNDRLFEQANFDTQNRYERDAYINAFFGSNL